MSSVEEILARTDDLSRVHINDLIAGRSLVQVCDPTTLLGEALDEAGLTDDHRPSHQSVRRYLLRCVLGSPMETVPARMFRLTDEQARLVRVQASRLRVELLACYDAMAETETVAA